MVGTAVFIAVVIVLQVIATFVKFGPFSITLALAPIVVGSALYGKSTGTVLGLTVGIVVLIMCITGADPGGFMLWNANPALTAVLCLLKGGAAGFISGLAYSVISKKNMYAGVVTAAILCPIVNTGIFFIAMALFYKDTLSSWAGGTDIIYYLLFTVIGINFIIEFCVNVVLSPAIFRIIKASRRA